MTFKRERFCVEKPVAANYVTPSGVMCVEVKVPDDNEHVALLQGFMAQLTNPENWQGTEAEQAQLAYLWEVAYVETEWENCMTPEFAHIDLYTCNGAPSGGTITYFNAAHMPFNFAMFTDNAANHGIKNAVWLRAGDYDYIGWHSKNANCGIVDVTVINAGGLVDTILSNVDLYASTFTARFQVFGSFTIPTDGEYSIAVTNDGTKNALASAFAAQWTYHGLQRTA